MMNNFTNSQQFHDVALPITLGSTNGSAYMTSSLDKISPTHSHNEWLYLHVGTSECIIYKKLYFLWESNLIPDIESFKH